MPRAPIPTLSRKIQFYVMNAGIDRQGNPNNVDLVPALRKSEKLKGTDAWYLSDGDDIDVCACVDQYASPLHIRLAKIRRNDFPQKEEKGVFSELDMSKNAGLSDFIHIVAFPDNIVGVECNGNGPRIAKLPAYLNDKSDGLTPQFNIERLIRGDVLSRFKKIGDIRLFQIRIQSQFIDKLKKSHNSLAEGFEYWPSFSKPETIEVILRPNGRRAAFLSHELKTLIAKMASLDDFEDGVLKCIVTGINSDTEKHDEVDFLSSCIFQRKRIPKDNPKSKYLNSSAAFEAIEEAYVELADEIKNSSSITYE